MVVYKQRFSILISPFADNCERLLSKGRQVYVPSEATLLDELKPGKITGAQYRRTGNDPIDLRPIPSEPAFLRVE
jgi:hypothetical protein